MRRALLNGLVIVCAGLTTSGLHAALPLDSGPAPGADTNRPGIVVPVPIRGGTETNGPA
jgi:hypothetical protein